MRKYTQNTQKPDFVYVSNQDFGYVPGALERENSPLWEKWKKHLEIYLKGSLKPKNTKIQPAISSGGPCETTPKSPKNTKSGFGDVSGALERENGPPWEKNINYYQNVYNWQTVH